MKTVDYLHFLYISCSCFPLYLVKHVHWMYTFLKMDKDKLDSISPKKNVQGQQHQLIQNRVLFYILSLLNSIVSVDLDPDVKLWNDIEVELIGFLTIASTSVLFFEFFT